MEWFSAEFFTALLSIIVIDLVLAGDNAIVIGMAARNLPAQSQKKVILWGTAGAVVIRIVTTIVVVWLLKIPGLLLAGGLVLIWISVKLLAEQKEDEHVQASQSIWAAVRMIIIADAVMGLDNVLAVAGAAHDNFVLVIIGLLISVPIVVWGSTLIARFINRFPVIIYIGAGVLAFTSAKMLTDDPFVEPFFHDYPIVKWMFVAIVIAFVIVTGGLINKARSKAADKPITARGDR